MGSIVDQTGDGIQGIGGSIMGGLGLKKATGDYDGQQANLIGQLQKQSQGPDPIAMQQAHMLGQQGLGNTLAGIAQTKGLNPSAMASMADIAGSRIQGQNTANETQAGLQGQMAKQNLLAQVLGNANAQSQKAQSDQYGLFGKNLQSGAAAFAMA